MVANSETRETKPRQRRQAEENMRACWKLHVFLTTIRSTGRNVCAMHAHPRQHYGRLHVSRARVFFHVERRSCVVVKVCIFTESVINSSGLRFPLCVFNLNSLQHQQPHIPPKWQIVKRVRCTFFHWCQHLDAESPYSEHRCNKRAPPPPPPPSSSSITTGINATLSSTDCALCCSELSDSSGGAIKCFLLYSWIPI